VRAYINAYKQAVEAWVAEVISEQDYHERGAHAFTWRTREHKLPTTARKEAEAWADRNGYTLVTVEQM
jgi:hypothetical protein